MSIHGIWHNLEKKIQDKFHGKYGKAAYREAVIIIFMSAAHKLLRVKLNPKYLEELERTWYGSLLPSHPLHGLRCDVQATVGDWALEADDYLGGHLQDKLSWLDTQIPRLEQYIDGLLAPPPTVRRSALAFGWLSGVRPDSDALAGCWALVLNAARLSIDRRHLRHGAAISTSRGFATIRERRAASSASLENPDHDKRQFTMGGESCPGAIVSCWSFSPRPRPAA